MVVTVVLAFALPNGDVVKRKRAMLLEGSTKLTELAEIIAGKDGNELWPSSFAAHATQPGHRQMLFSCYEDDEEWVPVPHFCELAHLTADGHVQLLVESSEQRRKKLAIQPHQSPKGCESEGSTSIGEDGPSAHAVSD